ncbi:hypothetical protein HU200_063958 [Digitaria exilis]|uniref:Uncharacterized protein n=1 Tax=Digitaria exilis TaxID=1010633 RepID=A0A835A101_9POAL|nr:hypothetical protein HU200_063958 [Digitaria exilis]CAB3470222.1 unnamed protein product [Digitaria exilis]
MYHSADLVAVVLAQALALGTGVRISGGSHINPAITFNALHTGRVSLLHVLLYWAAQLLGSIAAALLLRLATGGDALLLPDYILASGVNRWHVVGLAVGLLAGANVLACGAFDGTVMNPMRAFGPAIVGSHRWANHWVYWVGRRMHSASLSDVLCYRLIVAKPITDENPAAIRGSSRRA